MSIYVVIGKHYISIRSGSMNTDGPITSLEEPLYIPESDDNAIETTPAVFPGTDMSCFAYIGKSADALRVIFENISKPPFSDDPNTQFPGPQPCSVDRSHFETIRSQRYAIATKTDGIRATLMVTDLKKTHTLTLWDRTLSTPYGIYIEKVPRVLYQHASLLDGELVYDRIHRVWTFLIFDCVIINGFPQCHKNFWDRLESAKLTLGFSYEYTDGDTLTLKVKQFQSLHEAPLPGGEYALQNPSFPSDGYILMPVDQGIVFGHHAQFFKLKTCHSVDFVYKKDDLYVFNGETKRLIKSGKITGSPFSVKDGDIVECTLYTWHSNPVKRVWRYVTTRTDKSRSNTLHTLQKTLLNIEERLEYKDIRQLAPLPEEEPP